MADSREKNSLGDAKIFFNFGCPKCSRTNMVCWEREGGGYKSMGHKNDADDNEVHPFALQ